MTPPADPVVSAEVVLRPASPVPEGTPITSRTVHAFLPAAREVDLVHAWFSARGFEVGKAVGISFSITGTLGLFERVFGVRPSPDDPEGPVTHRGTSSLELPLDRLPADVRAPVVAVTFSRPVSFTV